MKENIRLIVKGLIIGLGKIIPGVSGGMLAISLGVYEKGLDALSHFFRNVKENTKFLCLLGLGILISVVLMSKLIKFSLDNYYLPTMLLFIGLIAGGLPKLFEKVKGKGSMYNFLAFLLSFSSLFILFAFNNQKIVMNSNGFVFLVLMGIIDAFTMIVPGISGTAILMLFGAYDNVISALSNLTSVSLLLSNMEVLLPFGIGMIIGIIVFIKLIAFLFNKFNITMYFIVIGLAISSTIMMVFQALNYSYTVGNIVIGLILFVVGYFIADKIEGSES